MKKFILLSVLFVTLGSAQVAVAQQFPLQPDSLYAMDTVANFETIIKADGFSDNGSFTVIKPDGSSLRLVGEIDDDGNLGAVVADEQTKIAGIYKFSLDGTSLTGSFRVFPGDISAEKSGIYSNKSTVPANGVDYFEVNVRITDEFSNPLQFHSVVLASNRLSDRIVAKNAETDKNGIAKFSVSSRIAGVSILNAYDSSAQTSLRKNVKIVFYKSEVVFKEVGGDPETILLAQAGQSVTRFVIENLPASVAVNQTVSFRVKAVDAGGQTVQSYTGTIGFSSPDRNTQYPSPYTFLPVDQGVKTFDLGLTFRTVGSQQLVVRDQDNELIAGIKNVQVVPAGTVGGTEQVRITKPAAGTYSVNTLEVAGEAVPFSRVKIYNNGVQVAEVTANGTGRFTFTTSLLNDGQHTFYAESGVVQSTPVTVSIDSTPAQIEQVTITKDHLAPGETTNVCIRSDPNLNSAQVTVGEYIADLESDATNPGTYCGMLTAPAQSREYIVNMILTDNMGNASAMQEIGRITVDAGLMPSPSSSFSVPSKVNGVKVVAGNGRVTMNWNAAQAQTGIAFYRIYYGSDLASLNLVANTQDTNTAWVIPNLHNGTKYYFQVVGVDSDGNEGDIRSDVAWATPSASLKDEDTLALCEPGPCPPDVEYPGETPQDGPEVLGVLIASLVGSGVLRMLRKKRRV